MAYEVEYTDTCGGEANYSWVRRARIPDITHSIDSTRAERRAYQATIMRRAKAAAGISGLRGQTVNYGDGWEFRPYRHCTVLFVTWSDQPAEEPDAADD